MQWSGSNEYSLRQQSTRTLQTRTKQMKQCDCHEALSLATMYASLLGLAVKQTCIVHLQLDYCLIVSPANSIAQFHSHTCAYSLTHVILEDQGSTHTDEMSRK